MATSYYSTGSVTLTNGSAVVTGNGTLWQTALIAAGDVYVEAPGNVLPIASVDSDTQITAELKWAGASGTYSYAIERKRADAESLDRNSESLAYLISEMRNGTLFKYDATGDFNGRGLYDTKPKGFGYLVTIGVSEPDFYVKGSNADGDWDGPFAYGQGPAGPAPTLQLNNVQTLEPGSNATVSFAGGQGAYTISFGIPAGLTGINPRGTYSSATAYAERDAVLLNGSTWRAKQATTGNAPPTLPATENAHWILVAAKGLDGNGAGDMVASVYDPQDRQADVYDMAYHVSSATFNPPGGRLTLTPGTPLPTADVTSATTIYYVSTSGNYVPVFDGSMFTYRSIGDGLALALDANSAHAGYHQASRSFDVFAFMDGTTLRIGTGPAWSSNNLSRGTGAGTTEIERFKGAIVNKNAIDIRFGTAAGNVVTVPARRATYLGSFVSLVAGTAEDTRRNRLLFNAYNAAPRQIYTEPPTTNYNYTTNAYQVLGGNNNVIANLFFGLAGVLVDVEARATVSNSTATKQLVRLKIGIDGTVPSIDAFGLNIQVDNNLSNLSARYVGYPGLGYHSIVPLQYGAGADVQTWYAHNFDISSGLKGSFLA